MRKKLALAIAALAALSACSETDGAPRPAASPVASSPQPADIESAGPTAAGLGLTVENHPDGLEVTTVERDSPAAKAGFRVGDVITALEQGRPTVNIDLPNPLALAKALSGYRAPAEIRFEVLVEGNRRRLAIRWIRLHQ